MTWYSTANNDEKNWVYDSQNNRLGIIFEKISVGRRKRLMKTLIWKFPEKISGKGIAVTGDLEIPQWLPEDIFNKHTSHLNLEHVSFTTGLSKIRNQEAIEKPRRIPNPPQKQSQDISQDIGIQEELKRLISLYNGLFKLRNNSKNKEDIIYLDKQMKKIKSKAIELQSLISINKTANTIFPEKNEKEIIIMRGVSGSGKSTLAKKLGVNGAIYSTDEFFIHDGKYNFDPKKISEAHQWNVNRVKNAMKQNISPIVVDNTNTKFWEMKPYILLSKEYNYNVKFAEPNIDQKGNEEVKTKDGKWNYEYLKGRNIHDVNPEILKRQIDRFEYNPSIEKIINSTS